MVIYWLLLTLIVMIVICYFIFKKDIMAPPFVACSGFAFSVLCCIYNIEYWAVDLHWITYGVIVGGLSVFIISAGIVYAIFDALNKKSVSQSNGEKIRQSQLLKPINIYPLNLLIFLIFSIIILALYYSAVMQMVTSHGGTGSWNELMHTYRNVSSYNLLNLEEQISPIIRWSFQIIVLGGYVCLYIMINNFVINHKVEVVLVLVVVFSLASSLLTAGRTDLIRFFVITIVVYYFLWRKKVGWALKFKLKNSLTILIAILLSLGSFVAVRTIVGRSGYSDPVYYITFYAGGPLQLLDMYLQNPLPAHDIWGYETFYGINRFIGDWFNVSKYKYLVHKEFRHIYGVNIGNVYTAFRSYVRDFGYVGMIILTSIFSSFFAIYHNILRRRQLFPLEQKKKFPIDIPLLIYAYLFIVVVIMFFADFFYASLLSFGILKNVIIICLLSWYFTRIKIVFSKKRCV